jgi:hypothetical protein
MRQATYVAAAVPDALTALAMMVMLSAALGMRSALSSILPEDTNSLLALTLPSPPRKTHRTSHQHQIDLQNAQKSKEVYAQALMRATILVAVAREKENHGPMRSILKLRSTRMPARRTSHSHPTTLRQYKLYYVIHLLYIHYHNSTIGFYFIK